MAVENGRCTEKLPKQFMIVAGFCYDDKLKIKKKSHVKHKLIHSTIRVEYLELIFDEDIPVSY